MVALLRRFSLGLRSTLAFGLIGFIVLGLGIYALVEINGINSQLKYVTTQRIDSMQLVNDLDREFLRIRVHTSNIDATAGRGNYDEFLEKLDDAKTSLLSSSKKLESLVQSPEAKTLFGNYKKLEDDYFKLNARYLGYLKDANYLQASVTRKTEQLPLTNKISDALDELLVYQKAMIRKADQESDAVSSTATTAIIIAIVLTLTLVAALSVLFTKSIVGPIQGAVSIAQQISQKNLTNQFDTEGNDEISTLIHQLQLTQESLRAAIGEIAQSSDQLASTSEELNSVTDQASRMIEDQSGQVEEASSAIAQLTNAIEAVAGDAHKTSDLSDFADEKARHGSEQVSKSLSVIEVLSADMETSSGKVTELAKKVNDITKVLQVIREIAEQTNLLALNAAIEAARAGESGRGFSVVADEVRALAQRTQESTVEIEDLVDVINRSSSESVTTMEKSTKQALETLDIARAARKSLEEIASAVEEIKSRNATIASAAEQQAVASKSVDDNLGKVRQLSDSTAAGAQQTSASADELAKMAIRLKDLTNQFRV
ncbi:methyl-accepting chemotaxis protein [Alteromonas sp. CYL-A6]|uniref:methyl-accepting chemotaxis protein n=1 Tax=Alteromonas nitratireducens TaxID=3390813 RepID=UPI0034AD688E